MAASAIRRLPRSTNVRHQCVGTAVLLDACARAARRRDDPVVTSDKVYRNEGLAKLFMKRGRSAAATPTVPKVAAEAVVQAMRQLARGKSIPLATARGGNVVGGGDFERPADPDISRGQRPRLSALPPQGQAAWQHARRCPAISYISTRSPRLSDLGHEFRAGAGFDDRLMPKSPRRWPGIGSN